MICVFEDLTSLCVKMYGSIFRLPAQLFLTEFPCSIFVVYVGLPIKYLFPTACFPP